MKITAKQFLDNKYGSDRVHGRNLPSILEEYANVKLSEVKTIYLIEGSFNDWDMHFTSIIKSFKIKEEAEKYKERIERIFFEFQKIISIRYKEAGDYEDTLNEKDYDKNIYNELLEKAQAHNYISEFNGCEIKEIKLI